MFRTIGDGPSGWELLLPPEVLRLPAELARVDALLDDPAFFAPFAPFFHPVPGRPSTPTECYLRLMFLKFRYRLGYESLCAEVSDSVSWRRFCRIPLDAAVPHPTTLIKLTRRLGSAVADGLNEALLAEAAGQKLLRVSRVRADTTVVPANVSYPTDSGLLARAIRQIAATGRRIQAAGGARRTQVRDRSRAAGRRAHAIAAKLRSRAAQARDDKQAMVSKMTGELAGLAGQAAAGARRLLGNARRALRRAEAQAALTAAGLRDAAAGRLRGRLRRAVNDLAALLEATKTITAQARQRLAGTMPSGATRQVSLHDGDARPIAKGRLGKPVEFGCKAQVTDNDDGIILDHVLEQGNPADGPQLAPAIGRVIRRAGRKPRTVTAGRSYGEQSIEDDLHDLGIRHVVIPRKGKPGKARQAAERRPAFRRAVKWRTGSEGRISTLKRQYGWDRTLLDGTEGARTWAGYGVLAHNLVKISALTT
ncbi:MAG: ISNCY family transposase [Streptosporangiaceae bacterium]